MQAENFYTTAFSGMISLGMKAMDCFRRANDSTNGESWSDKGPERYFIDQLKLSISYMERMVEIAEKRRLQAKIDVDSPIFKED